MFVSTWPWATRVVNDITATVYDSCNGCFCRNLYVPRVPIMTDIVLSIVKLVCTKRRISVFHYNDIIMSAMASQITSLTIVYSTVYSGADQRKHQTSASLAFVWGVPRWPVNSPHKWAATWKIFPFDNIIMIALAFTRYFDKNSIYIWLYIICTL